jgi:tRNA threonylcarbamoyl adenosine modification protein (Sua5/YciO/YrdC/YwlC family)
MIIEWNPERPKKKTTDLIVRTLQEGGIIAYPTDTYYGIGCDLFNIKSIRKLYAMKRLGEKSRLSIICRDLKDISVYAVLTDFSFDIVKWYLPGPFTFVLKARKIIPKLLMTDRKEVGVRIPAHPVPVGIANLCERPIINTSARIAGEDVISDPRLIERTFGKSISLIVDGGILGGLPSTVVSLADDTVEILRDGKGTLSDRLSE